MSEHLLTSTDSRGILTVTLNRPRKRNAFDSAMVEALISTFGRASIDDAVRVVVLQGNGPVFCSGGDIDWMRQCGSAEPSACLERATSISDLFDSLDLCTKPTVAAVQGAALGGAVGLLASCDFVIAAADTVIGTSEASLGIVPACLAPFLLAKIGPAHTRRLLLTGSRITADEAFRIGLVHQVVLTSAATSEAIASLIEELLSVSPMAQTAAKSLLRLIVHGEAQKFRDVRHATIQTLAESWASPDGQEGMAAFLEKRYPQWKEQYQ